MYENDNNYPRNKQIQKKYAKTNFDAWEKKELGAPSLEEKNAIKKIEAQKGGGDCGITFPYDKFAYGTKADGFGRNYINCFKPCQILTVTFQSPLY